MLVGKNGDFVPAPLARRLSGSPFLSLQKRQQTQRLTHMAVVSEIGSEPGWFLDGGAIHHVTNDLSNIVSNLNIKVNQNLL